MASESTAPALPAAAAAATGCGGRVAIVTGGARGIGYAIAQRQALLGNKVVLVDINEDLLKESSAKLNSHPELKGKNPASFVVLDVTKADKVAEAVEQVIASHGRIDILVQAAGIVGQTAIKTHEVPEANFDLVLAINLKGIFLMCKAVLPQMVKQKYGRIVNIASIAGKEGNAGMLAYSTSKAGVIGLTKVIGKEYAEAGDITCNAIAPAVVRTEMVAAMSDKQVKYMTDKIPMKRTGTLDEISSMVAFIASPECSFTSGFTFDATGGRATY